jgi:hypothetical protein
MGVGRTSTLVAAAAALVAAALATAPSSAQSYRAVNVNGRWLNGQELADADAIAGFRLPNGFYWYNPGACAWGVVGRAEPLGPAPCGGTSAPGRRVDPNAPGRTVIAPGNCEGGACVNISPDLK